MRNLTRHHGQSWLAVSICLYHLVSDFPCFRSSLEAFVELNVSKPNYIDRLKWGRPKRVLQTGAVCFCMKLWRNCKEESKGEAKARQDEQSYDAERSFPCIGDGRLHPRKTTRKKERKAAAVPLAQDSTLCRTYRLLSTEGTLCEAHRSKAWW